jgi:hypothetical protein
MTAPLDGMPILARTPYIIALATLAIMFPSLPYSAATLPFFSFRLHARTRTPPSLVRCRPTVWCLVLLQPLQLPLLSDGEPTFKFPWFSPLVCIL